MRKGLDVEIGQTGKNKGKVDFCFLIGADEVLPWECQGCELKTAFKGKRWWFGMQRGSWLRKVIKMNNCWSKVREIAATIN